MRLMKSFCCYMYVLESALLFNYRYTGYKPCEALKTEPVEQALMYIAMLSVLPHCYLHVFFSTDTSHEILRRGCGSCTSISCRWGYWVMCFMAYIQLNNIYRPMINKQSVMLASISTASFEARSSHNDMFKSCTWALSIPIPCTMHLMPVTIIIVTSMISISFMFCDRVPIILNVCFMRVTFTLQCHVSHLVLST